MSSMQTKPVIDVVVARADDASGDQASLQLIHLHIDMQD